MPYGTKGAIGATGALAVTGLSVAGWLVGAITLILLGFGLLMLVRRSPETRP